MPTSVVSFGGVFSYLLYLNSLIFGPSQDIYPDFGEPPNNYTSRYTHAGVQFLVMLKHSAIVHVDLVQAYIAVADNAAYVVCFARLFHE